MNSDNFYLFWLQKSGLPPPPPPLAPVFKHESLKTTLCQLSKPQQVVRSMNETIQQADYLLQWVHLKEQLSYTCFSPTIRKIPLIMEYLRELLELFHLWKSRGGSHPSFTMTSTLFTVVQGSLTETSSPPGTEVEQGIKYSNKSQRKIEHELKETKIPSPPSMTI